MLARTAGEDVLLIGGIRRLPAAWMAAFRAAREGDTEEAGLLFTKVVPVIGVVFGLRNIHNCEQISSVGLITKNEQVLANLLVFQKLDLR